MVMKRDDPLWSCINKVSPFALCVLCSLFSSAALASGGSLSTAFGIPIIQYGYVLLMASWGALASILQRFTTHIAGSIPEFWKVAISDYVNSILGAVIVFLACESIGVRPALEAIYFALAGFGGSRFMTAVYLRFESNAASAISRGLGNEPSNDPK